MLASYIRNQRALLYLLSVILVVLASLSSAQTKPSSAKVREPWRRVEVVRTAYGVPHIRAADLHAAGYALAWLQCEDYGTQTAMNLLRASGRMALVAGYESIESDLTIRRSRERHIRNYSRLMKETRDVYEGFAAGINRFVELYPGQFPAAMPRDFTGYDVSSLEIQGPSAMKVRNFLAALNPAAAPTRPSPPEGNEDEGPGPDDGSNAWAFAPSRTRSGRAILLRNPHLQWNAGYYEAHITVPGVVDFYGDFRIGGPFAVVGGFNKDLGWSTTNNAQDLDQIYSFDVAPNNPDHYLLDGKAVPLTRELVTAQYRNGPGVSSETREYWSTQFGPVIHRANGKVYVFKYAGDGEFRAGEQFLRMMRSKSLAEWRSAMKLRARTTSNFTYADRDGNIFFIWNASLPKLPHAPVNETTAVHASKKADVWTEYVPFDSLPQFLNPPGGYVHNENSSPHYTNVRGPINTKDAFPNFEPPRLSLRSQLAIQLIDNDEKYSLEDVVRLKHSYRALLADRVKPDLLAALKASEPDSATTSAIQLLERWDNTTSAESRGSVLFQTWWTHYSGIRPPERTQPFAASRIFAKVWSIDDPLKTPSGLADRANAVASFKWAMQDVIRRYGSIDVAWGDVYRVRRGKVDAPVGGCGNDLGCFRIMGFTRADDGKMVANSGDGWVLAVEFGDTPRAYSVLSYGQSRLPSSPYFDDQAAMFARGEMKKVAFTAADVDAGAIKRYRPGEKQ